MKKILGLALCAGTLTGIVEARTEYPLETQGLYYEIGGGDVVREPLNTSAITPIGLSLDLSASGGLSCDMWDGLHLNLDAYGDMVVEHLEQDVRALQRQIVTSMVGLAQGFATAALQRALPGMYDWSMNVRGQLDTEMDAKQLSCESVLADIDADVNPLAGWVKSSASYDWQMDIRQGVDRVAAGEGEGGSNVIRTARENANEIGEKDIPWFGGVAGGAGGETIEVVYDSVVAGYVQQAGGDDLTAGGQDAVQEVNYETPAAVETRGQRLGVLWTTADEAAQWVTSVVGEQSISFCAECAPTVTAGQGLDAKVLEEKNELVVAWRELLTAGGLDGLTIDELKAVSSSKVQVTNDVMIALADMQLQDQQMFVARMASDVAAYVTIEKAMAARKLLKTAMGTPEVQGNDAARKVLEVQADALRSEIEELIFEIDTNRKLVSDAPSALLAFHANKMAIAASTPRSRPGVIDAATMQDNVAQ